MSNPTERSLSALSHDSLSSMAEERGEQTILIVDDSASARRQVVDALERNRVSARIVTAESGAEALRMLGMVEVSLILCDVEMPGLDGFNFLRVTRGNPAFASIPIIMVTVKEDIRAKVQALTDGALDYLSKPYHEEELVARVRVHLRLHQLQRELLEKNAKLELMSRTDALTGLANRRHFRDLLAAEVARSSRYGPALSLVMVDVDHFKGVNDEHGHLTGDQALVAIARTLESVLRKCDYAARYGGEEFALLLPETDRTGALIVAERCRSAIEAGCNLPQEELPRLTASFGVASLPHEAIKQPDDLVRLADQALYAAKAAGRNRVCCQGSERPPTLAQA